jgi:hypothetical protein
MPLFATKEYDAVGKYPADRTRTHVGDAKLRPDVRELEQRLLKDGGTRLSRNSSMNRLRRREVRRLVDEGAFLDGDVQQLPGGTADAEASCSAGIQANPGKFNKWSGLAMRSDGMWNRHVWLIDKEDGSIVEASSQTRSRYYGVRC